MSNIAGLLSNLLPSPQPDASARGPSGQRDGTTPGKGGASGFDAILSKMGQNGAQQLGNPGGAAKSGMNLPGTAAAANAGTNSIIENTIASIDAQTPSAASQQSSNASAKIPGTPGGASANAALGTGTKSPAGTLAAQLQATATSNAQPAAPDANSSSTPASGVLAQLPAALAQALSSDATGSAGSADAGKGAAKSNAANPANAAADNIAANAAAMAANMVVAGQPVATPTSTDKANAGGKTSRSTNTDGAGRTTSKQGASSAKTDDATATGTILDPSLQSAVLASVGLYGSAPQPSQPSLLAPSGVGQGSSDPDLKAIMTASAVATANSAAKLGTGAEDTGDNAGLTTVSVLSTETHFAPPAQLSPVQQIADTVIGALTNPPQPFGVSSASAADDTGSTGAASAASASSVPDSGTTAIAGPVKILNLQLEPPSLGTVTINLSLSDGGLNVQLAASQASTMSIIDKDKDALSNQLRESGYSVAGVGVTITIDGSNVGNNGSATQGQMGQSAAQGGQTMSNGGSSNGSGSGQSGGNGSPHQPLPQAADFSPSSAARSPAAGDLYI